MLKFRSLTPQELSELETEFKHFLVINELYDAEWRQLATDNPAKLRRRNQPVDVSKPENSNSRWSKEWERSITPKVLVLTGLKLGSSS